MKIRGALRPHLLTRVRFALTYGAMRATLKAITVLVLVLSLGLHRAVLQTVAWTGMLISYSRDASLKEAVAMTFDGEHPCPLCKAIKQGRAEEKKQEQQQTKPGSKLDVGLVWQGTQFNFDCDREPITTGNFSILVRADEPPKPRPRGIFLGNLARA
jgi:hypothetical protein